METNNKTQKEKLWTKEYIAMTALAFFLSVSLNITGTVIPFFAQHLGGDLSTLGLVMAFFTASALVFRPYFGNMLDKKGRKLTIIAGGVIFSVVTLAYGIALSVIGLLALRFLHGLGFSAHSTAAGTIVADIVPKSRLTEGVGFFGISHTLSMALGPLIGLNLLEYRGFSEVFILAAVLGAISVVIAMSLKLGNDSKKEQVDENNERIILTVNSSIQSAIIEKSAIPASLVLLFIALTLGAVITFLPIFALSRGIGDIGIFFTVFALVQLIARPLTGRLADKFGFSAIMLPGLAFMAISMLILAFASNLGMFVAAGISYGLGFGSTHPTLNAILIKLCPPERRGVGNATFFSAMDIGIGTGAILWGIVSQIAGFTYVFVGAAICVVVASVLYIFNLNKQLMVSNSKVTAPASTL